MPQCILGGCSMCMLKIRAAAAQFVQNGRTSKLSKRLCSRSSDHSPWLAQCHHKSALWAVLKFVTNRHAQYASPSCAPAMRRPMANMKIHRSCRARYVPLGHQRQCAVAIADMQHGGHHPSCTPKTRVACELIRACSHSRMIARNFAKPQTVSQHTQYTLGLCVCIHACDQPPHRTHSFPRGGHVCTCGHTRDRAHIFPCHKIARTTV